MNYAWHDLAGNLGVALIVLTYLALQARRISSLSLAYSLLNAAGATLVLVSLGVEFNLSAFLVELFWLLISLYGIGSWVLRRRARAAG